MPPSPGRAADDGRSRAGGTGMLASLVLLLATMAFAVNCALGALAWLAGLHFGRWHHAAYAAVCVTTGACVLLAYHPALWLVVAALAAFPRARPHTWRHPALALLGAIGYLLAWTC